MDIAQSIITLEPGQREDLLRATHIPCLACPCWQAGQNNFSFLIFSQFSCGYGLRNYRAIWLLSKTLSAWRLSSNLMANAWRLDPCICKHLYMQKYASMQPMHKIFQSVDNLFCMPTGKTKWICYFIWWHVSHGCMSHPLGLMFEHIWKKKNIPWHLWSFSLHLSSVTLTLSIGVSINL